MSERKGSGGTQVFHYGDLSDMPTYTANGEVETTTSYVQGAHGLIEQRSGEATSYPLRDAHGDITAISGPTGGVESRQEYGPWGEQLSGPGLEMGYLGAQERPTDAATGLIQMGARTYDPSLGRFSTEDPVLGHMGVGVSVDRYPYAWDNPLNLYDLSGRDVCGTAGEVPGIGGFLEDACHVGSYHQPGEPTTVENVEYVGERASDFLKTTKNWLSHINLDPFGHKSCEKKLISSTSPFFPCEESEGGLEYKNSEPGTFVPPVDPMGPAPSPGSLIPVPAPTSLPQPVTPFIP